MAGVELEGATISAENVIPLGIVVAVMDAATGKACPARADSHDDALARCRLPFLTIEAGAG